MRKGHLPWSDFMVPWCKAALKLSFNSGVELKAGDADTEPEEGSAHEHKLWQEFERGLHPNEWTGSESAPACLCFGIKSHNQQMTSGNL